MKINELTETARIYKSNGDRETSCPNCGAAVEGDHCSYCGTTFIDFACIETEKPFYLKIKRNGTIYIRKARLIAIEQVPNPDDVQLYADNRIIHIARIEPTEYCLRFIDV